MGTFVTLGGTTSAGTGYLADSADPGPGVLVVHDLYGQLPHVRELCDSLAEAGFTALAPDLYGGRSTREDAEAERLLAGLDVVRSRGMLTSAARQMRAHPKVKPERIGAVGFSMGGWLALLTATTGVLDAVVAYYAALQRDERSHIECPVLVQLAQIDDWDPPETPDSFIAELEASGTTAELTTWPGTRHSFANADVPAYAPDQARWAWIETVEFLGRHLRDPRGRAGP